MKATIKARNEPTLGMALAMAVTGLFKFAGEDRVAAPTPPVPAIDKPIAKMRTKTIDSLFARGIHLCGFLVSSAA